MIGSPWNPHFTQALPGTRGKYDGAKITETFAPAQASNQTGAINHVDQPAFLQIRSLGSTVAVMQRNYSLHSESDLDAVAWAAGNPGIWGTDRFSDIYGSMFLWYYSLTSSFSGRMLWQSPADSEGYRWFFGSAWMHPAAYGSLTDNGYFNRPEFEYSGPLASFGSFEGVGTTSTPDWRRLWTLFYTDRVPESTDGAGDGFDHPAFTEFDTYPVYINSTYSHVVDNGPEADPASTTVVIAGPHQDDADIRFGMQAYSAIDLTKENNFTLLTDGGPSSVTVAPWYG